MWIFYFSSSLIILDISLEMRNMIFLNDRQHLTLNIFQHLQSNEEWLMLIYVYCHEE